MRRDFCKHNLRRFDHADTLLQLNPEKDCIAVDCTEWSRFICIGEQVVAMGGRSCE
jgi:hypothetical protein